MFRFPKRNIHQIILDNPYSPSLQNTWDICSRALKKLFKSAAHPPCWFFNSLFHTLSERLVQLTFIYWMNMIHCYATTTYLGKYNVFMFHMKSNVSVFPCTTQVTDYSTSFPSVRLIKFASFVILFGLCAGEKIEETTVLCI